MVIKESKIVTYATMKNDIKEIINVPQHLKDAETGVVYNKENVEMYRAKCDHLLALMALESNCILQLEDIAIGDTEAKITYIYLLSELIDLNSIIDIFSVHMDMIGGINGFRIDLDGNKLIYTGDVSSMYSGLDEMFRALHELVEDHMNLENLSIKDGECEIANKAIEALGYVIDKSKEMGLPKEQINQCLAIAKTNKFLAEQLLIKCGIVKKKEETVAEIIENL